MKNIVFIVCACVISHIVSAQDYFSLQDALENKSTATYLNLRGKNIDSIPPTIAALTQLESLILWDNKLKQVPDEIYSLPNLRYLSLRQNQFTTLSAAIKQARILNSLEIQRNKIKALPTDIGKLKSLEYLNCGENVLTTFPATINGLKK